MFRKPCVHWKQFWGLPSPPWNDCNGEFQEGGDGLQEEPQLHHRPNMEIPKVGDLVKWTGSLLWSLPHVSLCFFIEFSQVLWIRGLRAWEGLAVRWRALVPLLQGVHSLPHQLHICWSVTSDSFCRCHCFWFQATLRLFPGIFTSWQTRLASLNGMIRE